MVGWVAMGRMVVFVVGYVAGRGALGVNFF